MRYLNNSSTFYISAIKKRNFSDTFLIELELNKAQEVLSQFKINIDNSNEKEFFKLIENLEVLDTRLVLLNPKVLQRRGMMKRATKSRGSNSQTRLKFKRRSTENQK